MMFAPLEGWRHVKVTDRHTAVDYAHVLKDLADVHFANAKTIVLVQDNLNIHSKASLYEAFPARRSQAAGRALRESRPEHFNPGGSHIAAGRGETERAGHERAAVEWPSTATVLVRRRLAKSSRSSGRRGAPRFSREAGASNTPTIHRLNPSCRH
jgi:hypothetical protein